MNKSFARYASTLHSNLIIQLQRAIQEHDQKIQEFRPPNNPGKSFSKKYLLTLASTLGLDQITVILNAESIRERGLALIRDGEIKKAKVVLSDAESLCVEANLSDHAYNAARTFQSAAEAYLAYRERQFEHAVNLLVEALETSRVLSNDFGHDMEFRKVHLGRNIIRAQCFMVQPDEVFASTVGIIKYILGDVACWPFKCQLEWSTTRPLTQDEMLWSIDETIINLALPHVGLSQLDLTNGISRELNVLGHSHSLVAQAVYKWILAIAAAAQGKELESIAHATAFFELDPGGLVHAKKAILEVLSNISANTNKSSRHSVECEPNRI